MFPLLWPGNWDPVQIFVGLGLGAFGLLMLILAAWTTNVTNIYVASLALANMTGWLRVRTSTIASVAGILLAVAGIYSFQGLVNYLTLITALLIPTTGVLVVDYFVRNRRQMLAEELFKREDSAYWFYKGWNIRAVVAWACWCDRHVRGSGRLGPCHFGHGRFGRSVLPADDEHGECDEQEPDGDGLKIALPGKLYSNPSE